MDKINILKLYRRAVQKTGFRENKKNPGWMPKIGPNDYRSVIRHGWYKNIPSVIKVSPHEDLLTIANNFIRYQKVVKNKPAIKVPAVLIKGRLTGGQFLIQKSADHDQPQGVRVIKCWPMSTQAEKEEVAKLYWNTVAAFPKFNFNEWAISDYFVMRLEKTLAANRDYKVPTRKFITPQEKDQTIAYIFSNAYKLKMETFFVHFANTDIVKTPDRQYFIWESHIVPKPEAAGIALWLWTATLYAYNIPISTWQKEITLWLKTFNKYAPKQHQKNLNQKIQINFAERILGTLLLDLPLKRSPFDNLSINAIERTRINFRLLLKKIVSEN